MMPSRLIQLKTYLPHRETRLVNTIARNVRPAGGFRRMTIYQLTGGKRWSLALIVLPTPDIEYAPFTARDVEYYEERDRAHGPENS